MNSNNRMKCAFIIIAVLLLVSCKPAADGDITSTLEREVEQNSSVISPISPVPMGNFVELYTDTGLFYKMYENAVFEQVDYATGDVLDTFLGEIPMGDFLKIGEKQYSINRYFATVWMLFEQ